MKNILELREYDKITCNADYKAEYAYLPENIFRELEGFIRSFETEEEQSDVLDFMKLSFRRNVGNIISVNSYVGLIQMHAGYQIQILPKIDFGVNTDNRNTETKRIFLRMLRSMKDFSGKSLKEANLDVGRLPLYEIFVNMYVQEVQRLVKKGLRATYVPRQGNLNYYKGKLLINEQVKRNAAHGERFYMCYDEYLVDRAENRVVKATLLKLQQLSDSAINQKYIRQLLISFEMVRASTNYQKDFSKIVINRNTKDYEMLMRWSKVILLDRSFTTFSGEHSAKALLFPMEKVFESYVAKHLKKVFIDLNWDFSIQDKGYYLFDSPRKFALRPDIVMTRDDGSKIIMDTKWKSLIDKPQMNYGISQADMYQMYAYSKKYDSAEVWLLYPINAEMRGQQDISFYSNDGVNVNLFFVDVANIEESLFSLRNSLTR